MATLCAKDGEKWGCNQWVNEGKAVISYSIQGNMIGRSDTADPQGSGVNEDLSFTLNTTDRHGVCYELHSQDSRVNEFTNGVCSTVTQKWGTGGGNVPLAQQPPLMQVRRLTPTECHRLQGFPDGYCDIKDKTPDGPQYKALGNSMAVNVMRFLAERIVQVEDLNGQDTNNT